MASSPHEAALSAKAADLFQVNQWALIAPGQLRHREKKMSKEQMVAYLISMLFRDYGLAFCPQEQPIFALKLYLALEELETQARQEVLCSLRCKVWLN